MRPACPVRRRLARSTALVALLVGAPVMAQVAPDALPQGADRSDLVSSSGPGGMLVTLSPAEPRSVINWASYDIGAAASVHFTNGGDADSVPVAVLNRVVGRVDDFGLTTIGASNILGSLTSEANISVFLINQAGILFGQNASVSVGSLIASTRDIEPRAFLSSPPNQYRFAGTSDVPDPERLALVGDRAITAGSTDPLGFSASDVVALIAARVETRAGSTINAGRGLVIVAADDTTLTLNPGSPLQVRIEAGSSITTPMLLRGTLKGGSVIVAAATRAGLVDRLLDIDATMEATSATASGQGIILSAGRRDGLNPNIVVPMGTVTGPPLDNAGALGIRFGGSLKSAGTIDGRATHGIEAQPGGAGTLDAARGVYVRTDFARPPEPTAEPVGIALGTVTARLVSTTLAGIDIAAGAGSVSLGATAAGAAGSEGASASIAGIGTVSLDSLFAVRTATISGAAVTVGGEARSEGGALTVTAANGSVTANVLRSSGLLEAIARRGNLVADTVTSDGADVRVRAVDVLGRTTPLTRASIAAGQSVDLLASGSATLATVDGRAIEARAGGALSATRMSASAGAPTGDGLYASGATLDVGTAAAGSSARLIAIGGAAAVTTLNAGVDGVVTASGQASLGGGSVGRDLLVSGGQVRLGTAGGGGTQRAGRNAAYTASTGTIAASASETGLTIRANASGGGAGSIILDANTGIDLTGVALSTGDPRGTIAIGNIGVRLGVGGSPLTLGVTDANALLSVNQTRTIFSPLLTGGGAVTLGTVRLIDGLALSTAETIRLADVTIVGDGDRLSVTGTGRATMVTATGPLSASGGVSVTAPGAVSLADVVGGSGPVTIESTNAGLSADAVSGGVIGARARGALSLDSVTANAGTATLASAGRIAVGGATAAETSVTITANEAVLGDVIALNGSVALSTGGGALSAGQVSAGGYLDASAKTDLAVASAASANDRVTLASSGGGIAVTGAITARNIVTVDASNAVRLASVTAGTNATLGGHDVVLGAIGAGTLSATARGGELTVDSGDIRGAATLTKTGPTGAVSIARLTAGGPIRISSGGAIRADLLRGGATTVTATGDVSGRVDGLAATVGSLSVGTDGTATIAALTTIGDAAISAAGATRLTGAISAGGDLLARGSSVTLGSGAAVTQAVIGRIDVTSTAGAITGLAGLTLRSDASGAGGRDLTLRSAGGVAFADTLLTAGPDRQSAVRLGAGAGAAMALGTVEARTIASPGTAAALMHDGPVSIGRVATRGSLAVALAGPASALTTGPVDVRAGDLALDAGGALTTGAVAVGAGSTILAGAAVTSGAIETRGLAATARASGATFSTIDATAGEIAIQAVTDLRLNRADATGAITLTSGAGDITGNAVPGGFAPAVLASGGGHVTIRAEANDGVRGAVSLGTVDGKEGIDLVGRTITAGTLDSGGRLTASGASVTVAQATARGGAVMLGATGGDLRLGTATASGAVALSSSGASGVSGAVSAGGSYQIDAAAIALGTPDVAARQAGADVTLTGRTGAIAVQGSTTLAATRGIALTANGGGGAITLAPETSITSGDDGVVLATRGTAAIGTVTAGAGAIRLEAADVALTRPLSARSVTLANVAATGITRLGDAGTGNEAEFGASASRFDLNNAEVRLISAPAVTIASGARDVTVGALALEATTGSTRFAITTAGRIDMGGRFVAAGSPASRTIAIGNDATRVIRVATTATEGGRLLVGGAMLELSAERVGVGYDRDFLDAIGYRGAGLGVDRVTRDYVARPTSTLYNASALGAAPYVDMVLVQSGALTLTYGRYALIQNTGRPGEQRGVMLGTAGGTGTGVPTLRLSTPGSTANTFGLFGTIDGISSSAAALLGPDRVRVDPGVSPVASRINGCVIGSGAGCINTSIAQPSLNLFDASRAEIVRTADDLTLPFDPLIGTNNEALYLDPVAGQTSPDCEGDQPCPTTP